MPRPPADVLAAAEALRESDLMAGIPGTTPEAAAEVSAPAAAADVGGGPGPHEPQPQKPPAVKPFWERAAGSDMGVEQPGKRTPEEIARAYKETMSPEERDQFDRKRKSQRKWRILRTLLIVVAALLTFTLVVGSIAYYAFDWGIPTREEVVQGSIGAYSVGQLEVVRKYVAGGTNEVLDEFKAIPQPVIDTRIEGYERMSKGVRAIVVVTSGKQKAASNLRFSFELVREGLAWRIARVQLL